MAKPEEITRDIVIAALNAGYIRLHKSTDLHEDNEKRAEEISKFYKTTLQTVKEGSERPVSF
ncbi:hypothetical protein C2W64_04061 [Brevibacillus laterosporus]|nr:hypothetical protein [Brevibacillus laterosporus]RAP29114.1 hypothetical protein C2W64_04061 [Brevibacillus laterosporus]